VNLDGQVDNHAQCASPQFVARKAAGRFATIAPLAIANSLGNRLLMPIQGGQNWRKHGGQDDAKNDCCEEERVSTSRREARSSSYAHTAQTKAGF